MNTVDTSDELVYTPPLPASPRLSSSLPCRAYTSWRTPPPCRGACSSCCCCPPSTAASSSCTSSALAVSTMRSAPLTNPQATSSPPGWQARLQQGTGEEAALCLSRHGRVFPNRQRSTVAAGQLASAPFRQGWRVPTLADDCPPPTRGPCRQLRQCSSAAAAALRLLRAAAPPSPPRRAPAPCGPAAGWSRPGRGGAAGTTHRPRYPLPPEGHQATAQSLPGMGWVWRRRETLQIDSRPRVSADSVTDAFCPVPRPPALTSDGTLVLHLHHSSSRPQVAAAPQAQHPIG